jgi:hypothetical protein
MLLAVALLGLSDGVLPSHEADIQYGPGGPRPDRVSISWTVNEYTRLTPSGPAISCRRGTHGDAENRIEPC